MNRIIYQTVEDRENPDYVEQHGPFICTNKNAWLGEGYYFWDTIIELAHWWGNLCYKDSGYIICQSACDDKLEKVFDLVGRPEHLIEMKRCSEIITKKWHKSTVYVPEIIAYLKQFTQFSTRYKAIRANPLSTLPNSYSQSFLFKFNNRNKAFIDVCPAIQFCFFDKSLFTEDYLIVYPEMYCQTPVI